MKNLKQVILFFIFLISFSCSSNEEPFKEIIVDTIAPSEACIGDIITITGSNFTQDLTITINNIQAEIVANEANILKIIIPEGVQRGQNNVVLKNNANEISAGNIDILIDDYYYLTFENQSKKLYLIGNNTIKVQLFDELTNINNNVSAYGFVKNQDFLYIIDFNTNDLSNILVKYNVKEKTSQRINLQLPQGISGNITGLHYNPINNNLIGVVTENPNVTTQTKHHIIEINHTSGLTSNKDLNFEHSFISSLVINNNQLYIFSNKSPFDFSKIDLNTYSYNKLKSNDENYAIGKARIGNNNQILALQIKSDVVGNFIKVKENYDLELISSNNYYYTSFIGNGYYDKNSSNHIELFEDHSIENSSGNQPTYNSFYSFTDNFIETKKFFRPQKTNFTLTSIIDIIEE